MAAPAEIVTSIPDSTVNIVIGAGVMGISAALALKRTHPERSIYLLNDFSTTVEPASRDTGKIVRRKYVSPQYVALADEAIGLWKGEVSYEQIWHGCGWWVVGLAGAATRSLDVVLGDRQGQGHGSSVSIKDKTAQDRFRELFPLADMNSIAHLEYDASAAWVDASAALEATLKMAEDAGVVVKDCKVSRLLWKDDSCVGVDLSNGDVINAASVLLAMGPETPGLLNLPKNVGERVGVSLLGVQLTTEQYEKYKDMPILAVDHRGEILPPNKDKIIKINNSRSFLVPDLAALEAALPLTDTSPYFDENLDLLHLFLPDLKEAPIAYRRYCLDLLTPKHDFHIGPVPESRNVYVAFGGSFHGWKFLPNIGKYIVSMMDGEESFFREWTRWAGCGQGGDKFIHEDVIPRRTFPGID